MKNVIRVKSIFRNLIFENEGQKNYFVKAFIPKMIVREVVTECY